MEGERRANNDKIISFIATATEELKGIRYDINELKDRVGIQNGRVFKLEFKYAMLLGAGALLGIIGSIVSMAIMWFHK